MDQGDFLILSGAYISPELVAEFGTLPPAFLPFGNKRLYEHHIEFASTRSSRIFMTLPSNYQISENDIRLIQNNDVCIIRSNPDASLAEAISSALLEIKPRSVLHILHGDTIVSMPDNIFEIDIFACGSTTHYAIWSVYQTLPDGTISFVEKLNKGSNSTKTICGYFCFANSYLYQQYLSISDNFIDSLNLYSKSQRLTPVTVSYWLDFGHLHTYFYSRQSYLLTRHFNSIRATRFSIEKKGAPPRKIYAEAHWFHTVPTALKPFLPQIYSSYLNEEVHYEIEYLFLTTLSELLVFGELPPNVWDAILLSCIDFINCMGTLSPKKAEIPDNFNNVFFEDMIVQKSYEKCDKFMHDRMISSNQEWKVNGCKTPSLNRVVDMMLAIIRPTTNEEIRFLHGDFHFANIMFDFRSQRIKTFDPRGMLNNGTLSIWGDLRYDIAKLTHSVIGLYDFIITDRYQLSVSSNNLDLYFMDHHYVVEIQNQFKSIINNQLELSYSEILAMTSLLFLSMLPLHSDSPTRQNALLANGLRLAHMAEVA